MVKTTPNSPAADHISRFCAFDGWDAAIVIPAKDEAERIVACLTAAALSASRLPALQMGIVLVVNNSSDATAAIACDWAVRNSGAVDIVVVEKQFSQAMRGVGAARRFGLELAVEPMTGNGVLLMTDADTIVSPTWVGDNLAELHGADIVCGRIDAIPEEQAALPVEISQHGSWESDYVMTTLELSALLDPLPHDPRPAHHNGAGASMAFTSSVYQALAGCRRSRLAKTGPLSKMPRRWITGYDIPTDRLSTHPAG